MKAIWSNPSADPLQLPEFQAILPSDAQGGIGKATKRRTTTAAPTGVLASGYEWLAKSAAREMQRAAQDFQKAPQKRGVDYELFKKDGSLWVHYKQHDAYWPSSRLNYTYQTNCVYLYEHQRGSISDDELKDHGLYLHVSCGEFAYAMLPSTTDYAPPAVPAFYEFILGVTGTLHKDRLPPEARALLEEEIGIQHMTYCPSMYGELKRDWDPASADCVKMASTANEHFLTITDEIKRRLQPTSKQYQGKRAVLVFFESNEVLESFYNSSYFKSMKDNTNRLTEASARDDEDRDSLISKATRQGQVTLATRVFGRGIDFVVDDEHMVTCGGLHVLCTFFPPREERGGADPRPLRAAGRVRLVFDGAVWAAARRLRRRQGVDGQPQGLGEQQRAVRPDVVVPRRAGAGGQGGAAQAGRGGQEAAPRRGGGAAPRRVGPTGRRAAQPAQAVQRHRCHDVVPHALPDRRHLLDGRADREDQELHRKCASPSPTTAGPQSVLTYISRRRERSAGFFDRCARVLVEEGIDAGFELQVCMEPHECSSRNSRAKTLAIAQIAGYSNYNVSAEELVERSTWETQPHNLAMFLRNLQVRGGWGPEAVEAGLMHALQEHKKRPLSQVVCATLEPRSLLRSHSGVASAWRQIILIGDAPPNPMSGGETIAEKRRRGYKLNGYFNDGEQYWAAQKPAWSEAGIPIKDAKGTSSS